MRSWADFATALRLLTIIPAPVLGVVGSDAAEYRRAVSYYTWVGALLGAVLGAIGYALHYWLGLSTPAAALMLVLASFALTRGMHWDALSDVADAWWSSFDRARRLEIMSDPHVGAFGVFALVAAFGALVLADHAVLSMGARALSIFVGGVSASRASAIFGAYLGTPAKSTGLGASISGPGSVREWAVAILGGAALSALLGALFGSAVLALLTFMLGLLLSATLGHLIALRMGGTTGDVLGAGIMVSEIVTIALSAWLFSTVSWWG